MGTDWHSLYRSGEHLPKVHPLSCADRDEEWFRMPDARCEDQWEAEERRRHWAHAAVYALSLTGRYRSVNGNVQRWFDDGRNRYWHIMSDFELGLALRKVIARLADVHITAPEVDVIEYAVKLARQSLVENDDVTEGVDYGDVEYPENEIAPYVYKSELDDYDEAS